MFNAKYVISFIEGANNTYIVDFTVEGFISSWGETFAISGFDCVYHQYETAKDAKQYNALKAAFESTMHEISCSYARGEITIEQYGEVTKWLLCRDIRDYEIIQ